jgi:transposase
MQPYSLDLRQRIVDLYNQGQGSIRGLAERFQVSPDCVRRLLKQHRATGSVEPKPHAGGPKATLDTSHHQVLRELLEADNDATLQQLAQHLALQTGIKVSGSTISRTLTKLKITRKKSLKASEVYSEAKQQQRRDYWQRVGDIAAENLVFIDETGVNLAMVLAYARAQRGQRAYAQQPKGRGKNISIIGAMTLKDGFLEGVSFTGGTTGDVFLWFIETRLCPVLWPGAVVVMDNLTAHKVEGVQSAIEAVGARVVYLSPYSPEFNPIENLWSKLKGYLRAVEARHKDGLHEAISQGLSLITLQDVCHWFTHCCYCA